MRYSLPVRLFVALLVFALACPQPAQAVTRIKDITDFEGVRDNMLVGYGLVVGLNNTGDSLNKAIFTKESIVGMLDRLGVNARSNSLSTNNICAVMVTATLPAFSRQGTRIDVTVSAIGDAKSLLGGTLVVTPLLAADGEVYAVAQGPVAIGGFSAGGAAASITKGVPTSGRIANGAIVERELGFKLSSLDKVTLTLRNADFTTARRVAAAINQNLGSQVAQSLDSGTVNVAVPAAFNGDVAGLMTRIEQLPVQPDLPAKVVIDEQSGIVVIGQNVRISTVAIAQGNLTIKVTETPLVSQPSPFSENGETVVVPRTEIEVTEDGNKLGVLSEGVSLQELVSGLNALGISPRDLIAILQSIKASGALQAEIEVM
ncbi:MAG: flagellar basal body P-ring protein FlgI [Thalassospira sp.]|jgi:flagellar P-ring protein precursor FlgI|nr:flagellar basal body P-ring protein FlgI [Thalassospira sp.]